jgi:hypothetical protein
MADATNTPASRSTAVANPVGGENEKTSPKTMIHTGTTALRVNRTHMMVTLHDHSIRS